MNTALGLRILSEIMQWSDEEAREEFRWLAFMSSYKYDGYREYLAGALFIESLATWLQQFEQDDRYIAYEHIKESLIYFSPPEIHRLIAKFFPEVLQRHIQDKVSRELSIPKYMVRASERSLEETQWQIRKTLFMGLSDGARLDDFRRASAGLISNEQVALTTEISNDKWQSLVNDLEADLDKIRLGKGKGQRFSRVYLIDDFTASGTSFIREEPSGAGTFKGKMFKFAQSLEGAEDHMGGKGFGPFEADFSVIVHHYIGTRQANDRIQEVLKKAKPRLDAKGISNINFTFGMTLPADAKIDSASTTPFANLCRKYYDDSIYNDHFKKSGCPDGIFGYAGCGLSVVLEHNTPNNSLPLLWAETKGQPDKGINPVRPLFRRRQRHT